MYRAKTPARKNEFRTHELMAFLHVSQELNFALGARGEVGVPSFRTYNYIPISIPKKCGFAQSCPCRNHRLRRLWRGAVPPIQYGDFRRYLSERQKL